MSLRQASSTMRSLLSGMLLCSATCTAWPQAASIAAAVPGAVPEAVSGAVPGAVRMSFDFTNPGLSPANYHIDFDTSGLGHYRSNPGETRPPDAEGLLAEPFDQQIQIGPAIREQLLAVARSRRFLSGDCESRQHKVAFTGNKTIAYAGPGAQKSCAFNWSQDAQLMKVAGEFMAISLTLEEGRRLRLLYLHDRLSLDAELETLASAVKNGTALELENIAPELQAIAGDSAVMKRAQARAAALLAGISSSPDSAAMQIR